jgi:hypothetical protein
VRVGGTTISGFRLLVCRKVVTGHAYCSELAGDLLLELSEKRKHVISVGGFISSFDIEDLESTHGIIAGISVPHCFLEEGCRIGVDDDCCPGFIIPYLPSHL